MTHNEIAELEVQKAINNSIDNFKSFRFNAGAGAGKTYALIETLRYVTTNKIVTTKSPQKVACITYTNVAVNEIKSRLGNSDIVQVSTIHERLWDIIKNAQPELLICHKEKIISVLDQHNNELNNINNKNTKTFAKLTTEEKLEFISLAIKTKDLFYKSEKLNATAFRDYYKKNIEENKYKLLDIHLKNIENFKKIVKIIYKIEKLEACLERISTGIENRVNYDSKVNLDRLHYMKFSHDTLLEYGLKLINTYPTLCRIIIDTYPYIFIDEYQDTHCNVISFFKTINEYANKKNKNWMVGYFGDTAQNIYNDGVGRKIEELHSGLINIQKIFNRRSHQQIIDIANKIRADNIVQKPIFEKRNEGSVKFYYHDSENKQTIAQQFLSEYQTDLFNVDSETEVINTESKKIHCLVLTNKLMASFNGFGDVYDIYQNSSIYFENLNTQVLSQQLEKLHPTILTIYYLISLYQDLQKRTVSYFDIFGSSSKNLTFAKASLIIQELETDKLTSLGDWIDLITDRLKNSTAKETLSKILINRVHYEQDKVTSSDIFRDTLMSRINSLMSDDSEEDDKAKEKILSILNLPIKSLVNWVNFIDGIEADDISYHTYHGTKGEEYNNVAIILEHSFGNKNRDKFKDYFLVLQQSTEETQFLFTDPVEEEKHINTQNLLYVACSRAIKNLRVLYLDDISEIQEGIKSIFGELQAWPVVENRKPA